MMHVGIIGAGPGGINAARHALKNNFTCTVFEQNGEVGGTWVYTDEVDTNKFGIPVHSSTYQGLVSNLPKQTMEFPDLKYPPLELCYLPAKDVLAYFRSYVEKFDLEKHIKFYHQVKNVLPLPNNRWSVTVRNLLNKTETIHEFDAIVVANGHYHTPKMPNISGMETFPGKIIHSHAYRSTNGFEDQRILVVGIGPSGLDLTVILSDVANMIFLSHHSKDMKTKFPNNVVMKPDVKEIRDKFVVFEDGSDVEVDSIILGTGYKYDYPFLDPECGIEVKEGFIVTPLFKHIINIEHPTMALLGVLSRIAVIPALDLQNRFFFASLTGKFQLPSKEEMFEDLKQEFEKHRASGKPKAHFHVMELSDHQYFDQLSEISGEKNIPKVLLDLTGESVKLAQIDLKGFRRIIYEVLDDETFEVIYKPEPIR